jgi:single-strand DNA-binding protein
MQMNRIEIAGYISAAPEARQLPSGTKVVNVRLGESHRYKGSDYQTITQTNWHSLTFYNALADLAMTFGKGINLFVVGTMQQRKFTPKDGSERTVHEVIVQSCHVIAGTASASGCADPISNVALNSSNGGTNHDENFDSWPM